MKTIWKESPGYGLMKIHDDTAARRLDFDLPDNCGHTCVHYQRLDDSDGEVGATMVSIQIS
ncbi:hypothetical protein [Pontibacter sp. HSC-36F09]|uniref:hypothetical protein n=1 Tax=Pontibacter sp. HSC-36F09 TaxID=2910966 RepID=UPI00209ED152|nr:hypothetical protein [Pontibacter sp. HSC-36F09]MCP2044242.1 hypothetical protein [Pontibacter sp. HSC-36F09]